MSAELTDQPPRTTLPLARLTRDAAPRLLTKVNGLTFKAQAITDPDDGTATQVLVTLASDEEDTMYSSTSTFFGNMQTIDPENGDVTVLCYSTTLAGDGFFGGIDATIAKPSGIVLSGSFAVGVQVFGADAVVTGQLG
jgi:hypothetical protein